MAGQRQKPREELAFKRGGRTRTAEDVPPAQAIAGGPVPGPEPGETNVFPVPENMELLDESKAMWRMVVPTLRHVAAREYGHLLRWIYWWNQWFIASTDVEICGVSEATMQGGNKMRPEARWLQTCEMNLLRFETTLGLNPQARMRLGITFAAEQSALERLKGSAAAPKPARMKAGSR